MERQGAEATVNIDENVEKKRLRKSYRHPELDHRIRTERTKTESRLLKEAGRNGVNVPKVLNVTENSIELQRIDGEQLKNVIENKPELAEQLGVQIAKLHGKDIIHGDITTSNVIVGDKLYVIDFGLASRSQRVEDRAVDIHLLKQVLNSSHPDVSEAAWKSFIEGYRDYSKFDAVMERLEEVEKRGRYK
jgi:Kae1-associated kinase Bud32